MLAKILISTSLEDRVGKATKILATSLLEGNLDFRKHPDILVLESGEKLGIEQAKIIKEHLSFKPFQAKGRGVVIENASNFTPEAQNALLKTLEELPDNSILILGANSEHDLLPTILSRCEIVILSEMKDLSRMRVNQENIETLVNSSLEERFEYIEKLKDKKEFLLAMIQYFREQLIQLTSDRSLVVQQKDIKNFLKELLEAEKWINQNVNPRGILEYLMLVMPNNKR